MDIQLHNKDYREVIKSIRDKTADAVIIDPPYGVLGNHTIETKIDIPELTEDIYRVLNDKTFYAVFGQQPHLKKWMDEADKHFKFKQEIIWCKRDCSVSASDLTRLHENILVYQKGMQPFYKTKGSYEDVSQPMTMDGLMNIESIFRELSYLKGMLNGRTLNNTHNKEKITHIDKEIGGKLRTLTNKNYGTKFNRTEKNFSSIWSFLPHNKKHRNEATGRIEHPTVKSIEVMERLIELTTPENGYVIDFFAGSGTTAIACIRTGRNFIGCEIETKYYDIAMERINNELSQLSLF